MRRNSLTLRELSENCSSNGVSLEPAPGDRERRYVAPGLVRGLPEIMLADNVVSVEDSAGSVAADLHGNSLRDSGPDHIANCRPSQIVKEPVGDDLAGRGVGYGKASRDAGRPPRSTEVHDGVPVVVEH